METIKKKPTLSKLRKLLKDKQGSGGATLIFAAVFIIIFSATMVYGRAFVIRDQIEIEVERAMNIAVQMTMKDRHRQDHISNIDTTVATAEFYDYLHNELGLNSSLEYVAPSGKVEFRIAIASLQFVNNPPHGIISGTVFIPLETEQALGVPIEMDIPFSLSSRNQRMDEWVE